MIDVEVGDPDFLDVGLLQEIEGASRALEAGAKNEHPHVGNLLRLRDK